MVGIASISNATKSLVTLTKGMMAQQQRMLVVAQNIANAKTRAASPDQEPYRRQTISFVNQRDRKTGIETVRVKAVRRDMSPLNYIYDPGDPAANAQGFVAEPNVRSMIEVQDLGDANRSHDACLKGFEKIVNMIQETIGLLKA